jgi:peptidoglycan hydrolase-like protein with peptidoglycan-binding domain
MIAPSKISSMTCPGSKNMRTRSLFTQFFLIVILTAALAAPTLADDLTARIQKDLVTLGYDPGNVDGENSDTTIAAIAQFQAERDMPVTGEASPLLAGINSAEVAKKSSPAGDSAAAAPARDPAELQAAQQACLQEKIAAADAANKKKRGFGRLFSAVSRTASQTGNNDLAKTTSDVYNVGATADDLSSAAKDLGITEDEIAECQNPP